MPCYSPNRKMFSLVLHETQKSSNVSVRRTQHGQKQDGGSYSWSQTQTHVTGLLLPCPMRSDNFCLFFVCFMLGAFMPFKQEENDKTISSQQFLQCSKRIKSKELSVRHNPQATEPLSFKKKERMKNNHSNDYNLAFPFSTQSLQRHISMGSLHTNNNEHSLSKSSIIQHHHQKG